MTSIKHNYKGFFVSAAEGERLLVSERWRECEVKKEKSASYFSGKMKMGASTSIFRARVECS